MSCGVSRFCLCVISAMLCRVNGQIVSKVAGQHVGSIFKDLWNLDY